MRGETMKDKSKKSTYSTTFGVDPKNSREDSLHGKTYPFIDGKSMQVP